MPTEQARYIAELDGSRPQGSESLSESDDHHRLEKQVLLNTFVGTASDPYDTPVRIGPRALNSLSDTLNLNNFVTLGDEQTITGAKTFTSVIKAAAGIVGDTALSLIERLQGYTAVGNTTEETALVSPSKNGFKASYGQSLTDILHTGNMAEHIVNSVYPVGSVFYSSDPTSPEVRFPATTWQLLEGGLYVMTVGTHTDINGVTKTIPLGPVAGEYGHTITAAELPAHTHPLTASNVAPGDRFVSYDSGAEQQRFAQDSPFRDSGNTDANTGGGQAFDKQMPAVGLYAWWRTA